MTKEHMKATCPNNPDHKEFITVAHVAQDWVVDDEGNFINTWCNATEVVAPPHPDNIWWCKKCNAEAIITQE